MMPGPSIVVYQVDEMHHVVSAPCGNSSAGMTATDDLPIQVRRALDHARNCGRCLGDTAPQVREIDLPEAVLTPQTRPQTRPQSVSLVGRCSLHTGDLHQGGGWIDCHPRCLGADPTHKHAWQGGKCVAAGCPVWDDTTTAPNPSVGES